MRCLPVLVLCACLVGCGGGGQGDVAGPNALPILNQPGPVDNAPPDVPAADTVDQSLRALIVQEALLGDPYVGRDVPEIGEPVVQLGKALFFSTALGGEGDTACVSCHHPVLGGGDGLSLPVGVHAVDLNGELDSALIGPY